MTITREQFTHYLGWEVSVAVTHVFVNDPTRGYGINIDKILLRQVEGNGVFLIFYVIQWLYYNVLEG